MHISETASGNVSVALKIEAANTGQAGITIQAGQGSTNRSARIDLLNSVASATVPRWTLINDYNQTGINDFSIADNSTNRKFTILQGGNIGIGTTTPRSALDVNGQVIIGTNKTTATDYQLSVDGKIYCQELNVTPSGSPNWAFPDYVFKSDYKLASLTEVEKYIKENGHLEHVPSAEQVAKTGYKVGEMDATLLRKVEELTLYLLAQQKEIEALKTQIKK